VEHTAQAFDIKLSSPLSYSTPLLVELATNLVAGVGDRTNLDFEDQNLLFEIVKLISERR
jgi:hypothetical protein